jgi:hypothetical protein
MKTEMELEAIEVREDRLLMKSPPDDWNKTRVFLTPSDVVNVIRISFHRGMIGYILLLPFYIIADYLRRERDSNEVVVDLGYAAAGIFMVLLLLGGTTYLLDQPVNGSIVLGIISGLFILLTARIDKSGFLYLGAPLAIAAHFLLAFGQGIDIQDFPKLALGIILTLLILGKSLGNEREGKLAQSLYHTAYLVELVFVTYIAFNGRVFAQNDPWGASLPLLAFSLLHFVRYIDTRDVFQLYVSMPLLGAGFLLILFGIPILPIAFYGLALVAFSMAMILVADRYHESYGMKHVAPVYIIAIILALLAFAYAWRDLTAMLLTLALFSIHFFGGTRSLGIKSTAEDWAEKSFQWLEFSLANIAAAIAAILLLTIGRTHWASIIAAFVYVYFYFKMGLSREPTVLKERNQYLWAGGVFYSLAIFIILGIFDPLRGTQNDMLLVPLLLLPLLIYGRYLQRQDKVGPAASVFESSLLAVILSLLLPTILDNSFTLTAYIVAGLQLGLYILLAVIWREEVLLYAAPFLLANIYHNALSANGVTGSSIGLFFLPLALIAMLVGLFLQRRDAVPARTFYLAWFVFCGASVIGVMEDKTMTIYLIVGWAVLYLLMSTFMRQVDAEPQIVEMEGHV